MVDWIPATFMLQGVGVLLPWSSILSALDFFCLVFPDQEVAGSISIVFNTTGLACLVVLLGSHQERLPLRVRVVSGFSLMATLQLLLAFVPALYIARPMPCLLVLIGGVAVSASIVQASMFAFLAHLPPKYVASYFSGAALAGITAALIRIMTKLCFPGDAEGIRVSAKLFFASSAAVVGLCICTFLVLLNSLPTHLSPQPQVVVPIDQIVVMTYHEPQSASALAPFSPTSTTTSDFTPTPSQPLLPSLTRAVPTTPTPTAALPTSLATPATTHDPTSTPTTAPGAPSASIVPSESEWGYGRSCTALLKPMSTGSDLSSVPCSSCDRFIVGTPTSSSRLTDSKARCVLRVLGRCWEELLAIQLVFFTSLLIMPAFICSLTSTWGVRSWYTVLLVLVYNCADFMGRLLPATFPLNAQLVLPMAAGRVLMAPLFLPLVVQTSNPLLTAWKSDPVVLALLIALGFSQGYLATSGVAVAPRKVEQSDKDTSGILVTLAVSVGLMSGAACSPLLKMMVAA